jgi:G3E family GTPase
MTQDAQVPVTLLTGFLGAGKTTLLNRILTEKHGKKFAVIVNEYGEIGIDNDLVIDADEEVFEMNNGCICCTVRGDLIRIIGGLMKRKGRFDGIIVETTGLADPAPVAQTFYVEEDVKAESYLDAIVTVADAKHLEMRLDDNREAVEQIAFADVILLNKCDLVSPADLERVEARIRRVNPLAKIVRTTRCDAPLDTVLGLAAFDLERALDIDPAFLGEGCDADHVHDEHCGHHHHHTDHHAMDDKPRHDDSVGSVSLSLEKPLDGERLTRWLGALAQEKGQDLLRSKGILALRNEKRRFVYQGVHMQLDFDFQREWRADEKRLSRIVFIGRDLDREALKKGFEACAA